MGAAVRKLEREGSYKGEVRFEVIAVEDRHKAEIKPFDIGSHGLVGLDSEGRAKVKIPSHNFGRTEIIAKIETLLGR